MSARDLADEVLSAWLEKSLNLIDVPKIRERIHDEFDIAANEAEREWLLTIHRDVNDEYERQIMPEHLAAFQKVRHQDYLHLLYVKSRIGDGPDDHINPHKFAKITTREVAAGRMSPDDELHKLVVAGATVFPDRTVVTSKKPGFFAKMFRRRSCLA